MGFKAHFTPATEIGWRFSSDHWGKGYATEAAKKVLQYAFDDLRLKEVVSFAVKQNKRSIRVMEKIGLKHDPKGDFIRTGLGKDNPLAQHILFRVHQEG